MIKKIFSLFSFIALCNIHLYSQNGWTVQTLENITLNSVFFTSTYTGYTVGMGGTTGDSGLILKTTNGGSSWTTKNIGMNNYLYSLYFTDSMTGYAVGINAADSGLVLKTIDGGNNWTQQVIGTVNYILNSVYFTNANTGYIVGYLPGGEGAGGGIILKTINQGTTWTTQSTTSINLYSVYFTDTITGYAVGDDNGNFAGIILKTYDGGITLSAPQTISGTAHTLNSVYFTDSLTGYAVGIATILSTVNGGSNWTVISDFYYLNSVYFTNADTGYIAGSEDQQGLNGIILKTINAGTSWTTALTGSSVTGLNSVYFLNSTIGYAVGNGITAITGVKPTKITNPNSDSSNFKIFPNPNDGFFTLEFSNPDHQTQQIKISDITGKEILETTTSQELFNYTGNKLQSGIYIVRMESEEIINVSKMIVK
jgi:photosystem II stability/assembly factor-like uncharacterized protein